MWLAMSMGVGALLRRMAVLVVLGALGVAVAAPAQAASELSAGDGRLLAAANAASAEAAKGKRKKPLRYRKGVWITVPAAPSLLLARVSIRLEKPARTTTAAGRVVARRAPKPKVMIRHRARLPRGVGVTASIWRIKPKHRFVSAVAFTNRSTRIAASTERVYLEIRSAVPIKSVRLLTERLRPRDAATRGFGRCLFNFSERARTAHFVKRIGGRLPAVYTPRQVATAVTTANCGAPREAFLDEVGFPSNVAAVIPEPTVGPPAAGGNNGGNGGGDKNDGGKNDDEKKPGGGTGNGGDGGGGNTGSGNNNDDGNTGGGNNDGGTGDGGSGGGNTGGGNNGGGNPYACEAIAAAAGIDNEYVVAVTCDEDMNSVTITTQSGNPWTSGESLDGAGTCTTPSGKVKCSLDPQPVQALVLTSTKLVPVGTSLKATIGGLPDGTTTTIPVVFEEE